MPPKRVKQTSFKPPDSQYPSPFTKAPDSIFPFLGQLDPAKVYITHIDRHKPDYKQQIFTLALLLNGAIVALLAWRLYVAVPTYLALIQTFMGYASDATVDTTRTTRQEQVWILARRTLMMALDYALIRFIVPWPQSFFLERPANPVTWRWKIRFQKQEVVVRVCRNWEANDMMKGEKKGEDSPFFKTRIAPAINSIFMAKTGYLLMDGNWDLDFGAMQDAHTLVKQEKIKMEELECMVFVHMDGKGWLGWKFSGDSGGGAGAEEDNRKKMMEFKDILTKMGKESLFWKWQAIVEDERSADGSFTPETQERVAKRVAQEFQKNGVDFEEAFNAVGEVKPVQIGGG